MARTGAFSGSTFLFGAPLLSVHPIDNKMEPQDPKVEDGSLDPDQPIKRPDSGRDTDVTPMPRFNGST